MNDISTAWITGASQGIGWALTSKLAARGVHVAASARGGAALEARASESADLPGTVTPYPLDVTDPDTVSVALARLFEARGVPDLVVLNAGTHRPTPAAGFRARDLRELLELNVLGVANCLQEIMPAMLARGRGQIAVVASLAGYRGLPTAASYGATKAALINMCEALRLDLHGSGVTLQVVNPGFVKTPLTDRNAFPMPFLISAEEAADAILDGLHRRRFEIRFPTRFALVMSLLRHLPYSLYLPMVRRATGGG